MPAANALTEHSKRNVLDASEILDVLDSVIPEAEDSLAADLMAVRAQVEALQLGTARIHLRVNAAQVRTVINRDLGLQTEDRELGRLALAELAQKAAKPQFAIVSRNDYTRFQTMRQYNVEISRTPIGYKSELTIRFLDGQENIPAAFDTLKIIDDLGPLYYGN